jgi:hypothetical protein
VKVRKGKKEAVLGDLGGEKHEVGGKTDWTRQRDCQREKRRERRRWDYGLKRGMLETATKVARGEREAWKWGWMTERGM